MAVPTPPVLFLDIDEVVCFGRVALAMPGGDRIDPVSAAMIVQICLKTGARIVVTSTWRCSPVRCKTMFDAHGITPHLWSPIVLPDDDASDRADLRDHAFHDDHRDAWRVQAQNASRSAAIDAWLALHPDVTTWAIVDDSFQDFDQHKLGRLVHTDMMFGVGIREYGRAIRLLSGIAPQTDDGMDDYQTPRHTVSNLATRALTAMDQGDDDLARRLMAIVRDHPLAQ